MLNLRTYDFFFIILNNSFYLISFRTPKNQPESISVNVRNRIPVVSSKSSLVRKGDYTFFVIFLFFIRDHPSITSVKGLGG